MALFNGRAYLGCIRIPHPTGANYFTVDLAVLKELSQELADLFGLMLPVSCTGSKPLHP
jgi:hypothetical protein